MARYYEETALIEFVKKYTPTINGETTMKCVVRAIREAPTADVVPKSEVENIFAEIEEEIVAALKSNYEALPHVVLSDDLYHTVQGKIAALRGIEDFVAELKKKYTEASDET